MRIVYDLDLTNYNSYRINSVCRRAFFPETEEDIHAIFTTYKEPLQKVIIGCGNNVILSKSYYKEDFVVFLGNFSNVSVEGTIIAAEAGISMLALSERALEGGLSGLELFYDIPSSLGGAVVMNAGASGEEIKDLLVTVRYYNPLTNAFYEINKNEINFEYRNSFFQRNPHLIITRAVMQLKKGNIKKIREKMGENKWLRWAKQPRDFPNAGSVFKRPEGYYVGALVDELQMKGYTYGGAKISEKHGGFIINFDQAKGSDILKVIAEVKRMVKEKYNIELEVEQRII